MQWKKWLKAIKPINEAVIRYKSRERRVSYGNENAEKTFFVIRRNAPDAGLFSFVITNLGWIYYAVEHGYIPIIDMQTLKNTYLNEEEVGHKNVWELYFEQPAGYSLEDIRKSKNVILSEWGAPPQYPAHEITINHISLQKWNEFAEKYLILKPEYQEKIQKLSEKMFEGKRVLGVLCRGTDYKNQKPSRHPVQPSPETVIAKAQEVAEMYKCDAIYLATEDIEILNQFRWIFGSRLKYFQTVRYKDTGEQNINLLAEKNKELFGTPQKRGENYLMEIGLLARCNCLVAGSAGGTYGALLLGKGYEYQYVFDLGLYP